MHAFLKGDGKFRTAEKPKDKESNKNKPWIEK